VWALALLLIGVGPLPAQEDRYYREGRYLVHEIAGSIPSGAPRVRVETDVGSVIARASAAPEVRYRIKVRAAAGEEAAARRLLDEMLISAGKSGEAIVFRGQAGRLAANRDLSAEFRLDLPAGTKEVEVITGAGSVEARGLGGAATLATRGGSISADRIGGALRAETRAGNIEVGEILAAARLVTAGGTVRLGAAGGEIFVRSSGGDVIIGRAGGQVRAETGGGNVSVESASGDVFVQTRGGNIHLGQIAGEVAAATGGGSIRVAGAGGGVSCETAAGPIVLRGVDGPVRALTSAGSIRADFLPSNKTFFDSDLQTWQGDVVVSLPESLRVTIRAAVDNSLGQRIKSDFPLKISREAEDTGRPVESAEGTIGGGGSVLRIRTLGGSISIVKSHLNQGG
jgi:DUF4097 and DUF4098 domain-containing protein YvlB